MEQPSLLHAPPRRLCSSERDSYSSWVMAGYSASCGARSWRRLERGEPVTTMPHRSIYLSVLVLPATSRRERLASAVGCMGRMRCTMEAVARRCWRKPQMTCLSMCYFSVESQIHGCLCFALRSTSRKWTDRSTSLLAYDHLNVEASAKSPIVVCTPR